MKNIVFILLLFTSISAFPQKYKEIVTSEGDTLRVGQTITLGLPSEKGSFRYISQGAMPVSRSLTKNKVKIHKIQLVSSKESSNSESELIVFFKGYGMLAARIQWELARATGEVDRPK